MAVSRDESRGEVFDFMKIGEVSAWWQCLLHFFVLDDLVKERREVSCLWTMALSARMATSIISIASDLFQGRHEGSRCGGILLRRLDSLKFGIDQLSL